MGAPDSSLFTDADDGLIGELLIEYGARVREQVQAVLPSGEPANYLYDLMRDYPGRGGKMLRPCLCLATARAFGAQLDDALPSAVSIELMHNALLIHDDIEDGSDQRRQAPTLHARHGVPLALNAGDALCLLCLRPLKSNVGRLGEPKAMRILEETERTAWETTEGQALELGWRHDNRADLRDEDYLEMVLKKTCWLTTIHPMRVGALIGAGSAAPLDTLIRLGFFFGAAFQIQDDLLNLEGGAGYGKERDGDLLEGKRTLMVIHAIRESAAADRRRLLRYLGKQRRHRSASETAWVRSLLGAQGSFDYARRIAKGLAGAALYEFECGFASVAEGRDKNFIRALISWVLRRAH
jgi:geranylgeranyl diphosphate synthase, type II